jgi:DNA-binding NtrC family response regulator
MNARVIAASHRDLGVLVEEKRFRLDLYHRLMVFPIALPPLRERGEDVTALAENFALEFGNRLGKRFARLGPAVRDALCAYDFPGNVRELKNVIERAVILAPGRELTVDLLPERLFAARPPAPPLPASGPPEPRVQPGGGAALNIAFRPGTDTLDALERRLLEEALRMAGGKKARAAALLGISRFSLMRRVEKHRL